MDWNIVVYLIANYFAIEQHTKNIIFMNCHNDFGEKTSSVILFISFQENKIITIFFEDNVEIMRMASIHQLQVLPISINIELNAKSTIGFIQNSMRNVSNVGMVLDSDCQHSESIFEQVNSKHIFEMQILIFDLIVTIEIHFQCISMNCFPVKYKWLIYEANLPTNHSVALHMLSESNVFVDAEISYLNLNKSFNRFGNLILRYH